VPLGESPGDHEASFIGTLALVRGGADNVLLSHRVACQFCCRYLLTPLDPGRLSLRTTVVRFFFLIELNFNCLRHFT
jgi:hypothetical protein